MTSNPMDFAQVLPDLANTVWSIPEATYSKFYTTFLDCSDVQRYITLWIFVNGIYWFFSLGCLALDLTGIASHLKIQPGKNEPLDMHLWWKVVRRVSFNQITNTTFYMWCYYRCCTADFSPKTMPSFVTFLYQMFGFIVVEELMFYYSHRLFHEVPMLYKHVHKIHHEFTAPIGATARYAHWVEDLISNAGPIALGIYLFDSHVSVVLFWTSIAQMSTIVFSHAGYHFMSDWKHDFHHYRFNTCYGVTGWCDWFHGTNAMFSEYKALLAENISKGTAKDNAPGINLMGSDKKLL